jgi:hypothetical protein
MTLSLSRPHGINDRCLMNVEQLVESELAGELKYLQKISSSVIPHGLTWDRTWATKVGNWLLTA